MSKAFDAAVRYLARRDYGAYELTQKLVQKGYEEADIQGALQKCQRLGLQSDVRFVECLCRVRVRQGYGPQKITHDLQQVQIDKELIESALLQEQPYWLLRAKEVFRKKYGQLHHETITDSSTSDDEELVSPRQSYATIQKQKQFLLYRGFSIDTIHQVLKELC